MKFYLVLSAIFLYHVDRVRAEACPLSMKRSRPCAAGCCESAIQLLRLGPAHLQEGTTHEKTSCTDRRRCDDAQPGRLRRGETVSSTSEASSEAASSEATTSEAATSEGTEADAAGSSDFDATVLYYTYADTYISSVRTALDAELEAAALPIRTMTPTTRRTPRMNILIPLFRTAPTC